MLFPRRFALYYKFIRQISQMPSGKSGRFLPLFCALFSVSFYKTPSQLVVRFGSRLLASRYSLSVNCQSLFRHFFIQISNTLVGHAWFIRIFIRHSFTFWDFLQRGCRKRGGQQPRKWHTLRRGAPVPEVNWEIRTAKLCQHLPADAAW